MIGDPSVLAAPALLIVHVPRDEYIYKFRDRYRPHSSAEGFSGPFDSLEEALARDFLAVTDASVSVECRELSAAELAKRVRIYSAGPGHTVEVNGQTWRVSDNITLEKVQAGGPA